MLILFLGFPGTLKFYVELKFIFLLYQTDLFFSFFVIFVLVFLGAVGFARCWFSILYGMPHTLNTPTGVVNPVNSSARLAVDLTKTEAALITILVFLSFSFCFLPYVFV